MKTRGNSNILDIRMFNSISNKLKQYSLNLILDQGFIHVPDLCYWFPHPNISIEKLLFYTGKEHIIDVIDIYIEEVENHSINLVVHTKSKKYLIDFKLSEYYPIQNSVENNINKIIIDLSSFSIESAFRKLYMILFNHSRYKSMEDYKSLESSLSLFESNIKKYKVTKRLVKSKVKKGAHYELSHIDLCPINVRTYMNYNYANLRTDCPTCKYFLYSNNNYVCCMGESTFKDYALINNNISIGKYKEVYKYQNGLSTLIAIYAKTLLKSVRSSLIFHEELKYMVMDIGKRLGFYSIVEKKYIYINEHGVQKNGMIDVIWVSNKFEVAFEIDSGFRKRSIFKLSKKSFKYKFWIVPVTEYIRSYLKKNNLADKIILIDIPPYRKLLYKKNKS